MSFEYAYAMTCAVMMLVAGLMLMVVSLSAQEVRKRRRNHD